jgi:outer membrane protein assembly factor BamC
MNRARIDAPPMETCRVSCSPISRAVLAGLLGALALCGCSSIEDMFSGDKVDYRSTGNAPRPANLEVPPDLTQLSRDSRYQQSSGVVSASTFQSAASGASAGAATTVAMVPATPTVAPQSVGVFRIERQGNERWLSTTQSPEEVYPKIRAFWKDTGFTLSEDRADAGVLETEWAEDRSKLPNDIIRKTIGKVFDGIYSTGKVDKFRTRVERTATGSDIFITHRGMIEVYSDQRKENTIWQPSAADPQLEAEFLSKLMLRLGAQDAQVKAQVASASTAASAPAAAAAPVHARLLTDRPGPTLQVDDNFDRAWRRVGVALDRTGFTVEDRDRTQGVYFVRYVDPKFAGREDPNLFQKIFSKKTDEGAPVKYRVKVTGEGTSSSVAVLDSQGKPENSDNGKRIVSLLLDGLK